MRGLVGRAICFNEKVLPGERKGPDCRLFVHGLSFSSAGVKAGFGRLGGGLRPEGRSDSVPREHWPRCSHTGLHFSDSVPLLFSNHTDLRNKFVT